MKDKKILKGIKAYLFDWKNIVTHGIIDMLFVYITFFSPLSWTYRIVLMILVIAFNIGRMKYNKKKEEVSEQC